MKRILFSLLLAAAGLSASAMNYSDAREYAYFLTDKMAYELNLTPAQYDQVYEVNLDYFLSVNSRYDLYGRYRDYRDEDLRYILYDWQYSRYVGADYFCRPLSWSGATFVFNIYSRYSYRDRYFFDRPTVYVSYRGSDWGYRTPDFRSPYYGVRIEGRYGGLRDSYVQRYGDYGYTNYYRNAPLQITEGRYGGRGWSYENGNGYYDGGAYRSPSYSAPSYYGAARPGDYAPSRSYYGGAATSGRRGTTYSGTTYGASADRFSSGAERSGFGSGSRSTYTPARGTTGGNYSSAAGNSGSPYTSGRRGGTSQPQNYDTSGAGYSVGGNSRSNGTVYTAPTRSGGGNAAGSGVVSGRR